MVVTTQSFLRSFQEFLCLDVGQVDSVVTQTKCETCSYSGYDETTADCLLSLHIAHNLAIFQQSSSKFAQGRGVKKLKTKQDEVEFTTNPDDPFGFSQTIYGQRLRKALDNLYVPFLANLPRQPEPIYNCGFFCL